MCFCDTKGATVSAPTLLWCAAAQPRSWFRHMCALLLRFSAASALPQALGGVVARNTRGRGGRGTAAMDME